jgi:hypothetical protein
MYFIDYGVKVRKWDLIEWVGVEGFAILAKPNK